MIGRPFVKSFSFLNEKVFRPIKHYFFPKQFTFITLAPQQNLSYRSFPHDQWHSFKSQQKQFEKAKLFGFFLISFFIGDWLYTFKNNQTVMYYYYVTYPLLMKMLETNVYNFQKVVNPFIEIIPKEKYQIPLVWNRLSNIFFDTQNKQKIKNQNVQKLKAQIEQVDKKFI